MYRRLTIFSILILVVLGGLTWLGHHSISIWTEGMAGTRLSEFAEVAEQIQRDVERKLDAFMEKEQNRPYTDYQYYYVPESALTAQPAAQPAQQQALPIVRSPLAGTLEHGLAYYNFQVESDGDITTPNAMLSIETQQVQQTVNVDRELHREALLNYKNVEDNLLPMLDGIDADLPAQVNMGSDQKANAEQAARQSRRQKQRVSTAKSKADTFAAKGSKIPQDYGSNLYIESLQKRDEQAKVIRQSRALVASNSTQSGQMQQQMQMGSQMPAGTESGRAEANQSIAMDQQTQGANAAIEAEISETAQAQVERQMQTERQQKLTEQIALLEKKVEAAGSRKEADSEQADVQQSSTELEKRIVSLQEQLEALSESNQSADSAYQQPPAPQEAQRIETQQLRDNESAYAQQDRSSPTLRNRLAQSQMEQPESSAGRHYGRQDTYSEYQQAQPAVPTAQQSPSDVQRFSGARQQESDTVEIRIEPFEPIVAPTPDSQGSIFGGQVFMVRKVRIEDKTLRQGFLLNEEKLIEEVKESAGRLVRDGMKFELDQARNDGCAYTAVLDFGFGHLLLNLIEADPDVMIKRVGQLKNVYFGIITVVLTAVILALAALWQNAIAQLRLAQKKDDFISAVSHELRTPLTSIRMYSEMLENNWVRSKEKVGEYYRNMRQESERLSRLIENVLDFSRIQRGRKRYSFHVGDINQTVESVAEMMKPYAAQHGFTVRTELSDVRPAPFDSDAVTQIVVNLVDNAIKYAKQAADKTVIVRTLTDDGYVLIEVEDHGPGVPHRQKKKIFDEFYRIGSESTRETTGTGLGLALVKRFAEAHDGFVQILNARPTGAIFRVGLSAQV